MLAVAISRCSPQKAGQSEVWRLSSATVPMPIVDRPAVALARPRVKPPDRDPDVGPGVGAEDAVIGDMLEQQHAVMLALDERRRNADSGERPQHRGFRRHRRAALGDGAAPIGPPQQQHLGKVAAGEALELALGDSGQLGHPAGEGAHPAPIFRARPFAPAATSAQAASKWGSSP